MAEKITIARPYAKAVFELAKAAKALDHWSDTLKGLAELVAIPAVQVLINDPMVTPAKRAAVLIDACGKELDTQGANLLEVLSENRRLDILPEIAADFEHLKALAENTIEVEYRAPMALDEAEQEKLVAALRKRLGREVELHAVIDESLLGGAVIRAGDVVIDGSVRTRLQRLASEMVQ
jgi:F-type H+-transporting ATPase subunit delta